jgi:hypothetical protein
MSHLRDIKKQTRALLAGLGPDADGVGNALAAAGVAGVTRSNRSCPVALFLSATMGADPRIRSVAVGPCTVVVEVNAPRDLRPAGRLVVQLPKPVRRFVAQFDAGHFPDLVRSPEVYPTVHPEATGLPRAPVRPGGAGSAGVESQRVVFGQPVS